MFTPSYEELKKIMKAKGYAFFESPDSINIIGIRNNNSTNEFDDVICVAWIDSKDSKQKVEYFPCTTKSGKHWLLNPINSSGTAILVEGQYRGAYKIGIHNRSRPSASYEALEQVKPMKYYRDGNKDSKHDYSGKIYEGIYKTNIHRAAESGWSKFVDKWSAGCQVITGVEGGKTEWSIFMGLVKMSAEKFGNSFTYTLLNINDF